MQEKIKQHLEGYEERSKQTAIFHKENTRRLDELTKSVDSLTKTLNGVVKTVDETLLPAYENQMDRKRAYEILGADRDMLGKWGTFVLTVGGIIVLVLGFIKFYIQKS